jgi:hypothetical protein
MDDRSALYDVSGRSDGGLRSALRPLAPGVSTPFELHLTQAGLIAQAAIADRSRPTDNQRIRVCRASSADAVGTMCNILQSAHPKTYKMAGISIVGVDEISPDARIERYPPSQVMVDLKTNFRTALANPSFSLVSVTAPA